MISTQISFADIKPKIIIVGAGLAGLTAAHRINKNNIDVEFTKHAHVLGVEYIQF